jgi:hypothetical protein
MFVQTGAFLINCAGNYPNKAFGPKGVESMNSRSKISLDASASGLEGDSRWELVQRIVGSQQFLKSGRLQDFLLYVCRCALEDRGDEISEQRIGERVFQRSPDYNPNEDNIVRSQARLLRQKLDAYFASEGEHEAVILRIPKGGYAPEFVERRRESPVDAAQSLPAVDSEWRKPVVRVLLTAVMALAAAVIVMAWLLASAKESTSQSAPPSSAVDALWSQMFSENLATTVIVPDHTFAMVQEVSKQHVDLATYLRRSTRPDHENLRQMEKNMRGFSIRRYTTFDGASIAVRVSQLSGQFRSKVTVRYARDMTLREFSPGNVVLIGRPLSNLWNELFESRVNFRFYSDLQRDIVICQNRSPQAEEQSEYLPIDEGAKRTVYASAVFLPNLNNSGNVLIIAGSSSGAQDIAAEFITNENLFNGFASKVRQGDGRLPYFEVLIRTITLAGVAQEPEVLAYRILEP